ncbi:hypothetical protein IscW_ISCW013193, partial [Ixodes scapularis]
MRRLPHDGLVESGIDKILSFGMEQLQDVQEYHFAQFGKHVIPSTEGFLQGEILCAHIFGLLFYRENFSSPSRKSISFSSI